MDPYERVLPASDLPAESPLPLPTPPYALFSVGQITGAAFFGSPIAGTILMAMNKRRLGQPREANLRVLGGLAITALLCVAGALLPDHIGNSLPIAGILVVRAWAAQDKPAFDAHVANGGRKASLWPVVGVSLATLSAVLFVLLLALLPSLHLGPFAYPSLDFGHDQHVLYFDGATEADARQLGEFLKRDGYFDGTVAVDVRLSRRGSTYVVGFNTPAGTGKDPVKVHGFERMGVRIASHAFPATPVSLEIRTDDDVEKTLETPPLVLIDYGHDQKITYDAAVGEAAAKKIGAHFQSIGMFGPDEKGKDVELHKDSDVVVVAFVVGDGASDKPSVISSFEDLRKVLADTVLPGTPIRIDLCEGSFQRKRSLGP